MIKAHALVVPLEEVDKNDEKVAGGKAANLGEMIQADFPVPGGFVITNTAYFLFIKENRLDIKIKHLLGTINFEHTDSIAQVSSHVRRLIRKSTVPQTVIKEIFTHYKKLGLKTPVAVRSSATGEDSKEASFAGQQQTFLNVVGEAVLIERVRDAWASLFEARAVYYRHEAKRDQITAGIALVVQHMVNSDVSGIMFTVDPVTGDDSKIMIEGIYGLGEYIVQGIVTPDHFEVAKADLKLLDKQIHNQKVKLVRANQESREEKVKKSDQDQQKVSDKEVLALSKLGLALEKHYYFPQDVEWAIERGKVYLVQTRPVTTLRENSKKAAHDSPISDSAEKETKHEVLLIGDPASPGIGIGIVQIISSAKDASVFKAGMVLVARSTNPDLVPIMKKASAIVTQEGGRTSHAAIVSREFGIPAVVGAPLALSKLKNGDTVTVNGSTGEIYLGSIKIQQEKHKAVNLKTATKVFVNLAEPELAKKIAALRVDGVGLLRAEFMIAQIGTHPKKMIEEGRQKEFVDRLADDIAEFCKAFYPRPVLYRTTDFKTNEYRSLIGGKQYEPEESNPMLGYRGAYRYIHDPRVFHLELEAIKKVREKMGLNNLRVMLPFVRTVEDLRQVKKIMHEAGLIRSHTFKLFMMVEIPSNAILINQFIDEGLDGVSIGSNDLTMLILGTDRDNQEVAAEFDEQNAAVEWAFERVIKAARQHGIEVGMCGQAPSEYPALVEKLVQWGIHSVSVSPDAVDKTRKTIHEAELKLLKKL